MTKQILTVELQEAQAEAVKRRVADGDYRSSAEVFEAALDALSREEAARDEFMRRKIEESLADPRPDIPAEEVFKELRALHAKRWNLEPDAA